MTDRETVYAAIDGEREFQDSFWPQDGQVGLPNTLTVGEFLLLIEEYTARARNVWAQEKKPNVETLDVIRKIAGIAVNCMEQHGVVFRTRNSIQ